MQRRGDSSRFRGCRRVVVQHFRGRVCTLSASLSRRPACCRLARCPRPAGGRARAITLDEYARAQELRRSRSKVFDDVLARFDALVTPTVPSLPSSAELTDEDDAYYGDMRWTILSNLSEHPAIRIAAGRGAGRSPAHRPAGWGREPPCSCRPRRAVIRQLKRGSEWETKHCG